MQHLVVWYGVVSVLKSRENKQTNKAAYLIFPTILIY